MSRVIAIAAVAATVAGLGASLVATGYFSGNDDQFASCTGSTVAGGDIGGPFELVDETGRTVTDTDIVTEPTLIYFGYTFCPDVCPLDTARNALAVDLLEEQGISALPVFITVDPARDTTEVLADYTNNFHEMMIGLGGSEEQVAAASDAYRTYFNRHDDGTDFYLVDHSTFSYLVLPEHGFVEFFRREDSAEAMAERVACYVDAA